MNGSNFSGVVLAADVQASGPYSASLEPLYKQYKPPVKELLALPRPLVYVLMASLVVVGVAYAIVGHLIKDLAIDIADCLLGPANDEEDNKDNLQHVALGHHPPVHPFTHNAFHVWDQDEVMVPLPQEESPLASPLLLAAIPYIPAFFPVAHSPTSHNSPPHSSSSPRGQQGHGLLQGDLILQSFY